MECSQKLLILVQMACKYKKIQKEEYLTPHIIKLEKTTIIKYYRLVKKLQEHLDFYNNNIVWASTNICADIMLDL